MDDANKAFLKACVDMARRTGAREWQLRYQDDDNPVVWIAVAKWTLDGEDIWECAAGMTPPRAAFKLLEQLIDGGMCRVCGRPTGLLEMDEPPPGTAGSTGVCWYAYSASRERFLTGCESRLAAV
jgi:hypothetical protein